MNDETVGMVLTKYKLFFLPGTDRKLADKDFTVCFS